MSTIEVHRPHDRSLDEARSAIDRVAARLADRFDVDYDWDGDTLCFQRPGVTGHIALTPGEVLVRARLGLLLMALKGPIEAEIHRFLDSEFS